MSRSEQFSDGQDDGTFEAITGPMQEDLKNAHFDHYHDIMHRRSADAEEHNQEVISALRGNDHSWASISEVNRQMAADDFHHAHGEIQKEHKKNMIATSEDGDVTCSHCGEPFYHLN